MPYYAAVFFVIAMIAAVLGFAGVGAGAARIGRMLFFLFLAGTAAALVVGGLQGS
jgi:uncharacterized membrane protein YtjA (UPF0391 family)